MLIKIIQVFADQKHEKRIDEIFKECGSLDCYFDKLNNNKILVRAFVYSEKSEQVMDILESYFSEEKDYRIVILPVEASIPRPEVPLQKKKIEGNENINRVSREELYASVSRNAEFSKVYLFLIAISSLVAGLGIIYGNFVVIIGAMVIAPLLGPIIALSLATILADLELAKKSIKTIAAGIFLALSVSFLIGIFMEIDPNAPEIAARTSISLADIAIALASGSAGAIAFTTGYFLTSLMGVMVAVALLPPLVVLGMLVGAGIWAQALPAFLLLAINFVCVSLAGITTFIAFKVRPRTWWEADRAKMASRIAISLWIILLAFLSVLVLLMFY